MNKNLLAGILLVSLFAACQDAQDEVAEIPTFKVFNPLVKDTTAYEDYVCDIASVNNVEIRARVKGYVESIHTDEGRFVKKGQLLFKVSSQEYKEELMKEKAILKSAQAELKSMEIDYDNLVQLASKDIVSSTSVDMAKAKKDAAKAKVEEAQSSEYSAQLKLSLCDIKAPFDGFVGRIPNKIGSLVDEGTLITTLSDNNEIFAYFSVSETDYLNFKKKQKLGNSTDIVELMLANGELYDQKGIIETTDGQFDNETGTIAFRARFNNPESLLKHGSSGKIRLERTLKNAVIIPQKATFEIQDKLFVYVINANNELEVRNIQILTRMPNIYVIKFGLSGADVILLEGLQLVRAGQKIVPTKTNIVSVLNELNTINK